MNNSVIKGTAYILVHGPDFVIHNGTTQTTEMVVNPESGYLKALPKHLRSYEDVLAYPPNQVYIGNKRPEDLLDFEMPWADKKVEGAAGQAGRFGKYGEIMPQDEFLGLMQICDVFDLVFLEKGFVAGIKDKLAAHPLLDESVLARLKEGLDLGEIEKQVKGGHSEPLYHMGKLVGLVKPGHDIDVSLTAHILLENIAYKASGVLALLHLVKSSGISKDEVDYVIDASEEACGDMNQRGGGNFAKAVAEIAGFTHASGSDTRGFCAAPVHALIQGASLVKAGTYKNVVVFAGGSTAKLGMNGKDHVKKELPILEDVMGGFAVLLGEHDGINPEVNTDIVGWHKVGTGSSPQAVMTALVAEPLSKAGLSIKDIDKYAAEMQNPDITKPAGAGDVPEANFKMIAALGVKEGALERTEIADFVKDRGMQGWAPTQGHIPSGVPYLAFAREDILAGKVNKAMIIGKGSLFLGRMTNLFDGVSVVLQKAEATKSANLDGSGGTAGSVAVAGTGPAKPVIGVAAADSELGMDAVYEGVALAKRRGFEAIVIESEGGDKADGDGADKGTAIHKKMEAMLKSGQIQGAVTMHYNFPIGVATVGRLTTPAKGKELFIGTTTGTTAADRVEAMVKNTVSGIAAAKACGIEKPKVGIANIEGARQVESALKAMKEKGYDIEFAESGRTDGGVLMRGNDILNPNADVMVMDSLTGNLMVKMLSAFSTGGNYESSGYGYGPGLGENFDKLVLIVSRASGSPVIAGAIEYATDLVKGNWLGLVKDEYKKAKAAGLGQNLPSKSVTSADAAAKETVTTPPKEIVTGEITGIEVMDIEDAAECLWKEGIYAETGMGCTGPVVLVSERNVEKATDILKAAKYL